jgi:hypothetical protein
VTVKALLATLLVACGGGSKPAPTTPPPSGGLVIVDDIDCPKLVNHMIDVHVAADPEKSAKSPEKVQQIRVDMEKECEQKFTANPPDEAAKASARCSMKATTTDELETCGS